MAHLGKVHHSLSLPGSDDVEVSSHLGLHALEDGGDLMGEELHGDAWALSRQHGQPLHQPIPPPPPSPRSPPPPPPPLPPPPPGPPPPRAAGRGDSDSSPPPGPGPPPASVPPRAPSMPVAAAAGSAFAAATGPVRVNHGMAALKPPTMPWLAALKLPTKLWLAALESPSDTLWPWQPRAVAA